MATKDTAATSRSGAKTGAGTGSTGADFAGNETGGRSALDREFRATRDWVRAGKDQAVGQAKSVIRDMADTQKKQAVDGLKGFTGALRKAADTLDSEQQQMIARYTTLAADEIDRITDVLNEKEWDHLVEETRSLARRQPALFLGGAMVTGFLLARFLKSSGDAGGQAATYEKGYGTAAQDSMAGSEFDMRGEAV